MYKIERKDQNLEDVELQNIAFLIGNGINYHDKYKFSWAQLLVNLLPNHYFKNNDDDLDEVIQKVLAKLSSGQAKLFEDSFLTDIENKKIVKLIKKQLQKQKNLFDRNTDGLSYPEIAELALRESDCSITEFKSKLADEILKKQNSFFSDKHNQMIRFAFNNNCPILTTNFDLSLIETSDGTSKDFFPKKTLHWIITNRSEDKTHLSNAYFREKSFDEKNPNLNVSNEFAIWHIHGVINPKSYRNSIKITNRDYANTISRLSNSLKKMRESDPLSNWSDFYSWIKIIMTNDLIIAGLGLESSETDLRWLLVERYIYHKNLSKKDINHRIPKTVYVYSNDLPSGTKKYYEKLNIELIEKEYNDVFDFDKYILKT